MTSKYDSKQLSMLNQLNDDKPKPSLANDPCVKMETKLPGDKIQLILEFSSKDKDTIFNALKLKNSEKGVGSAATSASGGKRKSDESSAINFVKERAEAKQQKSASDLEKRRAEMKAKAEAATKENKKKMERKEQLKKIQADDNFEHFKQYYEQDGAEIDAKKAVEDESYCKQIQESYDAWKENIEPELMQEAADDDEFDENNISTWDSEKQTAYLTEMMEMDASDQLEKLNEDPVITNSNWSIEYFANWLANGSAETTDGEREEKPFPGITEINGEALEAFEMSADFMPIWFSFVQNLFPEGYEDITLTYKESEEDDE